MALLDWIVVVTYLLGMVGMSLWLSRTHQTPEDYYVGGRRLPWWALAVSTMATQTSANSFIGIPAFVALVPGGGLTWLQYELAVPLALILVMVLLMPVLRGLQLISVYEYLERRFGHPTRMVMSGVFLVSRGLASGITLYATAVVASVCLGLPIWACILIIGVVTVVYDSLGGMAAVVYTDVVQMAILLAGLVACLFIAVGEVGSVAAAISAHAPERWIALDLRHGIGDGASAPLWGFLVGGIFLYASYYGVDQSQAQRVLSAPTVDDAKRLLIFNAVGRFPLTVLYVSLGLAVGAVYWRSEALRAAVPATRLDYLVPQYVLQHLPAGLRGLLFSALLAAAMSSLDSALNSLSACTLRDFVQPYARGADDARLLRFSKWITWLWGAALTGFAFFVGNISSTVVEGINKLGSVFYGPILAAFAVGMLDRRARGPALISGIALGVSVNIALWLTSPGVFWMWWNLSGLVVAALVTSVGSRLLAHPPPGALVGTTFEISAALPRERQWLSTYALLGGYFALLVLIASRAQSLLKWLGS